EEEEEGRGGGQVEAGPAQDRGQPGAGAEGLVQVAGHDRCGCGHGSRSSVTGRRRRQLRSTLAGSIRRTRQYGSQAATTQTLTTSATLAAATPQVRATRARRLSTAAPRAAP